LAMKADDTPFTPGQGEKLDDTKDTLAAIRYTLRRSDLLRWQLYGLPRQRLIMGFLFIASTYIGCLSLREPDMAARSVAFKITFVVLFDALLLGVVVLLQLALVGISFLVGKHRGLVGEHILEVRNDGLLERTAFNESLHRWAGFHRIKATRTYLYIFVTDAMLCIVPMRCFASPEEARNFQDEISKHIKPV